MTSLSFRFRFRVLLPLLAACHSCVAGGLYLTEISTTETSLAGAGWAARAQDPTTVVSNPAGMTELEGRQFQAMLQPLFLDVEFDDRGSTFGDGGTSDADAWAPGGSLFYTHQIDDKLTWGISLAGFFGLALEYEDDWAGRYYAQEVTLQSVGVQPTFAYKVNDKWSVGLGLTVLYGIYELETAVNTPVPGDGGLSFEDDVFSFQANFGVLYKLNERTRFGLQYFSESEQDFEDTPNLRNNALPIREVEINMTLPQSVILSGFHQMTDRFAVMGNVNWQEWSQFGEIGITTTIGGPIEINRDYDDTWGVAAGIQYRLNEKWLLNTGLAYDSSMVDDEDVTPDLPTGESIRWGIGTVHKFSDTIDLQFGYEIVYYGDIDIDAGEDSAIPPSTGRVVGEYPDMAIHFFSAGLRWQF